MYCDQGFHWGVMGMDRGSMLIKGGVGGVNQLHLGEGRSDIIDKKKMKMAGRDHALQPLLTFVNNSHQFQGA